MSEEGTGPNPVQTRDTPCGCGKTSSMPAPLLVLGGACAGGLIAGATVIVGSTLLAALAVVGVFAYNELMSSDAKPKGQ